MEVLNFKAMTETCNLFFSLFLLASIYFQEIEGVRINGFLLQKIEFPKNKSCHNDKLALLLEMKMK